MRILKAFRNSKGFSTIELITVTAIVGALVSLAVPSYQKFVAKARQGEGKAALARIYASEQSFFSEWTFYTLCLQQAGYEPLSPNRYYLSGFANARGFAQQTTYDNAGSTCSMGLPPDGGDHNAATWTATSWSNPSLAHAWPDGAYDAWPAGAGPAGFKAVAFGSISEAETMDTWTIDASRNIVNTSSGL